MFEKGTRFGEASNNEIRLGVVPMDDELPGDVIRTLRAFLGNQQIAPKIRQ